MELARLLAQLDDSLLGDLFSASALTRARAYVGRVRHIEVSGNLQIFSGTVSGGTYNGGDLLAGVRIRSTGTWAS